MSLENCVTRCNALTLSHSGLRRAYRWQGEAHTHDPVHRAATAKRSAAVDASEPDKGDEGMCDRTFAGSAYSRIRMASTFRASVRLVIQRVAAIGLSPGWMEIPVSPGALRPHVCNETRIFTVLRWRQRTP
jgi:hypothetical protein